jgi:hypothetical protein
MKKLIIFCDGGLGNRLGALIGGMLTAEKLNRVPIICWPENTWCGCSFNDIFDSKYQTINLSINELFSKNINNKFILHENQTNINIKYYHHTIDTINSLKDNNDTIIIYYHNSIPTYFSDTEVLNTLKGFDINIDIKNKVENFCLEKSIDINTKGIHLRKTDFHHFINEDEIFNHIVDTPNTKYFICSDNLETEEKFNILNNVITNLKNHYVEKFKEGSWNDMIIDNEGRHFNFNVNRTKDSVIEGFIDLLILSKTTIIVETHSTFLKFAKLYNKINI